MNAGKETPTKGEGETSKAPRTGGVVDNGERGKVRGGGWIKYLTKFK